MEGSIFSNHQHFAVSTGICGVACPLPASQVDKPLVLMLSLLALRGQGTGFCMSMSLSSIEIEREGEKAEVLTYAGLRDYVQCLWRL